MNKSLSYRNNKQQKELPNYSQNQRQNNVKTGFLSNNFILFILNFTLLNYFYDVLKCERYDSEFLMTICISSYLACVAISYEVWKA